MGNNPVNFNDPTGHAPECGIYAGGCGTGEGPLQPTVVSDQMGISVSEELGIPQEDVINGANNAWEFTTTVYSFIFEPADWAITGYDCLNGDCSLLALGLMIIPGLNGRMGRYADDAIKLIPSSDIYWSQKAISRWTTKIVNGEKVRWMYLDDLSIDMAQGWKGDPLRVLDVNGKLVSLDNRRLTMAKMLGIDVPVTIQKATYKELLSKFGRRDGIFEQIPIRGTDMIVDMLGGLK